MVLAKKLLEGSKSIVRPPLFDLCAWESVDIQNPLAPKPPVTRLVVRLVVPNLAITLYGKPDVWIEAIRANEKIKPAPPNGMLRLYKPPHL
jgi:hypothetical protein